MHFRGIPQAKETADMLELGNTNRVLDVGGGSGVFVFEFIRRNPGMKGVVFDLPAVTPITRKYIEREGFTGRVTTLSGDYLEDDPGSGYDLVFISAVIHINSPDENLSLIERCTKALNPGGQLVILDHIMDEYRTSPAAGAIFALNMLVGTLHGDTYTENEVREWMTASGLKNIHRKDSASGINLMTGIK
jgi:SAM-dependent methyltransferase